MQRVAMRVTIMVGALAVAALAGCTSTEKAEIRDEVRGARQQLDQATQGARQAAADAALKGKVKGRLESQKGLSGNRIQVDVKNGAVILKGDVVNTEQAELAERVARETAGVHSVENQLMLRVPAKQAQPVPPSATPTTPTTPAQPY